MADSTLSITKSELDEAIAHFLGYGRSSDDWSADQTADVNWCRKRGLARFYRDHDWSFLSPSTTLETTASDYDQDLPDDFGYLRDSFYFAASTGYAPLTITSIGRIRDMISQSSSSGIPKYAAISPKSTDGMEGQRFEVLFYPPPDGAYTLTYRYTKLLDALTDSTPYPYGGAIHGRTIEEACLAEAEVHKDDERGIHEAKYVENLAVSIANDSRLKAQNLGYNGDNSINPGRGSQSIRYCTYNGSLPS